MLLFSLMLEESVSFQKNRRPSSYESSDAYNLFYQKIIFGELSCLNIEENINLLELRQVMVKCMLPHNSFHEGVTHMVVEDKKMRQYRLWRYFATMFDLH